MIRPERHEALDERAFGHDALGERRAHLGRRDANERAPRLLARSASLWIVGLPNHPKGVNRIVDGLGRRGPRRTHDRRASLQLRAQPTAWIADPPALAGACAEPEPVEGA